METKDTVSSCSVSQEQEIQRIDEKAQLSKEGCMTSLKALQSKFTFLTDTLQDFGQLPIFKRTFSKDMDLLEQQLTKEIPYAMIKDMDFIMKYMLETILHQQEIQQLLNENKLQTQEVQSNTVQALKVDSVILENTCSGKDNSVEN
ncbi:hypothetical protein Tco_1382327 [Tanacetum coccineum]